MPRPTDTRSRGPAAPRPLAAVAATLALLACWSACGSDNPAAPQYDPQLPHQWAGAVTNRYFPLVPGTRWQYTGTTEEGAETTTDEVLQQARTVNGVQATVVHDQVTVDGVVGEDTYDWYAQDAAGNVWYLGEDSKQLENGLVVSTAGSWEWGVDGALPGIVMWADPAAHVGEQYRQEYAAGEAEDWGKVVSVDHTVTVPYDSLADCIMTDDWSALEKDSHESKYYCPDVGVVMESAADGSETSKLVQLTTP